MIDVVAIVRELVHAAGEEGVHLGGGEGLVGGVGGDAERLAEEHGGILRQKCLVDRKRQSISARAWRVTIGWLTFTVSIFCELSQRGILRECSGVSQQGPMGVGMGWVRC
tara:strand:- start:1840 stop:2169 length:330 start_codon:yes stop_codon:yes gene_type:complete